VKSSPKDFTPKYVEFSEHDEHTRESNHQEIHSDAPRRSKRQKTVSFRGNEDITCESFIGKIFSKKVASRDSSSEFTCISGTSDLTTKKSISNAMMCIIQKDTIHSSRSQLALLVDWPIHFDQTTPCAQVRE
jgi:hypothetical protein